MTATGRFADLQQRLGGFLPGLEGLRGVAILWVIFHNARFSTESDFIVIKLYALFCNLGWIGVQLFFVLSGFLITGILLDEPRTSRQLRRFYMRRVLRIFPLYYTALMVWFWLLPALGVAGEWLLKDQGQAVWFWTYLFNWVHPLVGGAGGLGHFWSLAVEEQFYLLWPLLVLNLSHRHLLVICGLMVVSAPLVRVGVFLVGEFHFAELAAYDWTPARWDALALGAALAILLRSPEGLRWVERWLPKVSLLALVYAVIYIGIFHNFAPVEGGLRAAAVNQTLAAVLSAATVYWAVVPARDGRWQGLLQHWPLRRLGQYSYALYVVHVPVYFGVAVPWAQSVSTWDGWGAVAGQLVSVLWVLALSLVLALVSWYLIERPALRLKRLFRGGSMGSGSRGKVGGPVQ